MRNYEIMFIVSPNAADEDIDKINGQIEGVITAGGGKAEKIEKLGKRRLAYIVKKFREGSYVLFTVQADGAIVREVERRLRHEAVGQDQGASPKAGGPPGPCAGRSCRSPRPESRGTDA